jgi:Crp-like helix-turn-helix domain
MHRVMRLKSLINGARPTARLGFERLEPAAVIGHVRPVHRAQRHTHRFGNRRLRHPAFAQQHHLARALFDLADYLGDQGGGRILIRHAINQRDLAAMAGVARENVSRVLSDWNRQKFLNSVIECPPAVAFVRRE